MHKSECELRTASKRTRCDHGEWFEPDVSFCCALEVLKTSLLEARRESFGLALQLAVVVAEEDAHISARLRELIEEQAPELHSVMMRVRNYALQEAYRAWEIMAEEADRDGFNPMTLYEVAERAQVFIENPPGFSGWRDRPPAGWEVEAHNGFWVNVSDRGTHATLIQNMRVSHNGHAICGDPWHTPETPPNGRFRPVTKQVQRAPWPKKEEPNA